MRLDASKTRFDDSKTYQDVFLSFQDAFDEVSKSFRQPEPLAHSHSFCGILLTSDVDSLQQAYIHAA